MKKLFVTFLSLLLCGALGTTMVYAAEQSGSSKANITFTGGGTDPVAPVDPTNPDNPGTGGGTGMSGPLSLDIVPTLNFGTQTVGGGIKTYNALELKPYIQVSDSRGTGAGWKVSVSLSTFTDTGTNSFAGTLSFANGEALTTTGNPSEVPTLNAQSVTSGEAEKVLFTTSAVDQGMGTWVARWFPTAADATTNDSVTLKVNTAGVKAAAYSATLNWILSDAP